jgi:leucyl-tRNA synthetase
VQSYVNTLQSVQDCNEAKIKMSPKGTKADDLQKLRDAGNAAIEAAVLALDAVKSALGGKPPKKVIIVPGRIVNVVA